MRTVIAIWLPFTFSCLSAYACIYISALFFIVFVLAIADMRSRYAEYRKLVLKRFSNKRLKYMRTSACQRYAAIAASPSMRIASEYYRSLGYRWYHLLPDGTFKIKSNPYLKIVFYKRLLGIK